MAIILNVKKGNISVDPTAFIYKKAILRNEKHEHDIQNLILNLKIIENLYSPTLICKVMFRDSLDLANKFKFTGEETFELEFERIGLDGVIDTFKSEFKVSHWSGQARTQNERIQVFEFSAISPEIYNASAVKISKHIFGNVLNSITEIADDIGIQLEIEGESTTEGSMIIPLCTPLQAISFCNRNLLDLDETPFYFFQNNQLEYELISHSKIVEKEPVGPYYLVNHDSVTAGTVEYYNQRKYRIINAASDFNLSKYYQMNLGLFAAKSTHIDFSKREILRTPFIYEEDFPSDKTLYERHKIDDTTFGIELNNHFSNEMYLSRNRYSNWLTDKQSAIMNAWQHIFTANPMEVTMVGNFDLKPGNVVDLEFPVTIDDSSEMTDKYISGQYIVLGATHEFENNEWYTRILAKRDSIRQE